MGTDAPRRSHAAKDAVDPRDLTRAQLREYLESVPTVSVEFAGACMGISRPAAYRAAAAGELRVLALGRRRLVPTVWLERVLMLDDDTHGPSVLRTAAHGCAGSDSRGCPRDAHEVAADREDT